jgi:aldehyde:ferredoxin oxidoreductase
MLDEYYEVRGWDKRTGIPTRKKLEELGIKEVANQLNI